MGKNRMETKGLETLTRRTSLDLTAHNAYYYETTYGPMRNRFQPGSSSSTKQILRNTFAYLKARKDQHKCNFELKRSTKTTAKRNDSLVAITNFTFGEVLEYNKTEVKLRLSLMVTNFATL